jgi:Ca-activated chloride channel family protein
MVLLSDGEDNVNEAAALQAAQNAARDGLKIFTVGIGTTAGDLIRVTDANGNSDYVRDADGNVVKTHLNEDLLRQIAGVTGGFYLPLRGGDTMDTLYDRGLAPLPKTEGVGKMIRQYHEQYQWPLAIAILLLLAEMLLPERKKTKGQTTGAQRTYAFSDVPAEPAEPIAAKPDEVPPVIPTATTVALIAFLLLPMAAAASPASALGNYNSGNYTNALDEFTRLAETQTNDLRLVFNAGDAAYRATNFDLAQGLFSEVTLSPDISLQQKAFYNLGNAQFQLAKQATDLDGIESGLEIAEKSYGRALDLNTNDADAAFNLSFTRDAVERIKEFRAMLLRAKNEADQDVRMSEFHQALEIMAPLQAKLQKTVVAKQYEDFTKKLKQIDDIQTPQSPGSTQPPTSTGLLPNP